MVLPDVVIWAAGFTDLVAIFKLFPLDVEALPFEQLYFPGKQIPPVSELAATWGDPQGQKIYSHPNPMFLRWLDVALAD